MDCRKWNQVSEGKYYPRNHPIDYDDTENRKHYHMIECDGKFHYWFTDYEQNVFDRATKCPYWEAKLKGEKIDFIAPLPAGIKKQTFENCPASPTVIDQCKRFINSPALNLIILGETKYKAHLANATLNQARSIGHTGQFTTLRELEGIFRQYKNFDTQADVREQFGAIKTYEFLVIAEFDSIGNYFIEDLLDFLGGRLRADNKTIFTTKLWWRELESTFGKDIIKKIKTKLTEIK